MPDYNTLERYMNYEPRSDWFSSGSFMAIDAALSFETPNRFLKYGTTRGGIFGGTLGRLSANRSAIMSRIADIRSGGRLAGLEAASNIQSTLVPPQVSSFGTASASGSASPFKQYRQYYRRNYAAQRTHRGMQTRAYGRGVRSYYAEKGLSGLVRSRTSINKQISRIYNRSKWSARMFGYGTLIGFAIQGGFSLAREAMRKQISSGLEEEREGLMPPMLDTARTYTGRQRALAHIHNSQMNARAIIGQEAMYFNGR